MNTRLKIGMFGGLCVQQRDRVVTQFRTHKTGALLAYLAFYRNLAHPREELIALLWPDSDLEQGRPSLSVALSSLRHQLEPPGVPAGAVLIASRATVQLNPITCDTDVSDFNKAIQSATNAGTQADRERLILSALDLYRGAFLPGYYDEWCLTERVRLAATYLDALRVRVKHLVQGHDLSGALDCVRRVVQEDPLCEESNRDLMRLCVALGRPAAAFARATKSAISASLWVAIGKKVGGSLYLLSRGCLCRRVSRC